MVQVVVAFVVVGINFSRPDHDFELAVRRVGVVPDKTACGVVEAPTALPTFKS
jgi:hypothetical protein